MVNDFLKKYQEELISDKIQLKEDMDLLETKIKEETKFLNLLEQSNESYFKEFTPRDINSKNNQKAAEIRQNLEELNNEMDKKSSFMKFYDARLVEVNALLTNTAVINKPSSNNALKQDDNKLSENQTNNNVCRSDLIAQLSNIKSLILLDPYRAQIELEKIISTI